MNDGLDSVPESRESNFKRIEHDLRRSLARNKCSVLSHYLRFFFFSPPTTGAAKNRSIRSSRDQNVTLDVYDLVYAKIVFEKNVVCSEYNTLGR